MKIISHIDDYGSPKTVSVDKVPMYRGQHPCQVPKSFRKNHPNYVLYMYSDPDWGKSLTIDLYGKACKKYYHEWHSFSDIASWCKNIEIFTGKFDKQGVAIYKKYTEYYANKNERS